MRSRHVGGFLLYRFKSVLKWRDLAQRIRFGKLTVGYGYIAFSSRVAG